MSKTKRRGSCGLVLGWSSVVTALTLVTGCGAEPIKPSARLSGYVIPLRFSYTHWDHHLLQWLPDHPRYEMAEALIDDADPANVFFFLTERNAVQGSKRQYCYSNEPEFAQHLASGSGDRESHLVDVVYQRMTDASTERYHLELDAVEGHVTWDFTPSSETSPDYASKLINAVDAAHDLRSGFLVFYLPQSAVVNQDTVLTLGADTYPAQLWTEISVPPYFEAYRGVHSRDVHDGYFGALPPTKVEYLSWPRAWQPGTSWQTRETTDRLSQSQVIGVKVAELEGDDLVLEEHWGFRYHVIRSGEALLTRALSMNDNGSAMRIDFDPPLPDLRYLEIGTTVSSFAVSLTGHDSIVTGQVTVTSTSGNLEVLLAPNVPDWTQRIRLRAAIQLTSTGYVYQSVTEYPEVPPEEGSP